MLSTNQIFHYFKGGMEKLSGCLQTCNAVVPAKFIFRLVLGQACKYPTSMRFTDRVLNLFLATAKWLNQGSQIRQIWRILCQNCSDDSTEITEGVTLTPEILR